MKVIYFRVKLQGKGISFIEILKEKLSSSIQNTWSTNGAEYQDRLRK